MADADDAVKALQEAAAKRMAERHEEAARTVKEAWAKAEKDIHEQEAVFMRDMFGVPPPVGDKPPAAG